MARRRSKEKRACVPDCPLCGRRRYGHSRQCPRFRDRCNQHILRGVISWRRERSAIHRSGGGCEDGEVTRCSQGALLARCFSAASRERIGVRQFCVQEGLPEHRYHWWRRTLRERGIQDRSGARSNRRSRDSRARDSQAAGKPGPVRRGPVPL